jgi:hypothetical protein
VFRSAHVGLIAPSPPPGAAVARCYHPQLLQFPEAEIFTPYNDLKTRTDHLARDKKMQKNKNIVRAMLPIQPLPD